MWDRYNDKKTYLSIAAGDCASQSLVQVGGEVKDKSKAQELDKEMNNKERRLENASEKDDSEDEIDERDDSQKGSLKSAGRISEYVKRREKNIAKLQKLLAAVKEAHPIAEDLG